MSTFNYLEDASTKIVLKTFAIKFKISSKASKRVADLCSAVRSPTSKDKPQANTGVANHVTNLDLNSFG